LEKESEKRKCGGKVRKLMGKKEEKIMRRSMPRWDE
jgi:hypothetical protein